MKCYWRCVTCGATTDNLDNRPCPHNSYYDYFEAVFDYNTITEFPVKNQIGLAKYLPLLPIDEIKISLGEGSAPLIRLHNYSNQLGLTDREIYVKNEAQNPTGCFKDLESMVVINKALEDGHQKLLIVSSGNAASSAAAYANKAGLSCVCVILKKTHQIKKEALSTFGGELQEFSGTYEEAYRHFSDQPLPDHWNITSGKNPLRVEGDKIIAFEIWEQLGVPDQIIAPVGNGSLIAGIWKGFVELQTIGKIKTLPRLIGVQVKDAAPLKSALATNQDFVILPDVHDSIAEGIVATESYCSPKAVRAIKESGGEVIEVTDPEIKQALSDIMKTESLEPEPTSAAVYAALSKVKTEAGQKVVCIQTGNGQRNIAYLAKLLKR
ncbi:MAG: pyridoxal-phosphate dependent enzyme [Candidatus Buchananbacteria bacterium]|nr:pyridoxal-phosphate dependent enzyme [Candidatus Buchananbacteria bacterium]